MRNVDGSANALPYTAEPLPRFERDERDVEPLIRDVVFDGPGRSMEVENQRKPGPWAQTVANARQPLAERHPHP